MNEELLPAPANPEDRNEHGQSPHEEHQAEDRRGAAQDDRQTAGSTGFQVPPIERIYQQIMQLNGLVLMGMISPAKANVIQRGLKMMLDGQLKQAQGAEGPIGGEALFEICRQNPQLLNLLEGFLTDDQAQWILREAKDGHVGKA